MTRQERGPDKKSISELSSHVDIGALPKPRSISKLCRGAEIGGSPLKSFLNIFELNQLLKDDCSGATSASECFRRDEPTKSAERITGFLLDVHALVQTVIPGIPVIFHGYDYAQPTGKGFLGIGQWLKEPMDQARVPRRLQRTVIKEIIDALATAQLAAIRPTFLPIDTRRTLSRRQWANELHPTISGFNKLARKWRDPLKKLGLA